MKACQRFVVLTAPRTGSNFLCTLLGSHPEILCHHEMFNASGIFCSLDLRSRSAYYFGTLVDRDRDPEAFLERMWGASFGHPVVGFKLSRSQNRAAFEAVLEDREVVKLVMRRRNRVATYVSEMVAQLTGEWESYPGVRLRREPFRIPVPPRGLCKWVEHDRAWFDHVDRRLEATGQEPLRLEYEDLTADAAGTLGPVLEALGLPAEDAVSLVPATRKQSPDDLSCRITNFDELAAALQGTGLEHELKGSAS